jgi:phenylalanyl-tRNA synthetase alpha chain
MSETPPDRSTIDDLRDRFRARLESSETVAALKALQDQFLSRKSGTITGLMKTLGSLPHEARREFGSLVNTLKTEIENAIEEKRHALESSRPPAGAVDITLPGRLTPLGHVHPLMRVRQQVEDIFTRMGYEILEGAEVEDDFHNFEALNMPPEHPARDMQDTLYLAHPIVGGTWGAHRSPVPGHVPEAQVRAATLLRTHTSAMQIRYMKTFPPPVRIMVPGRVYRRDNLDLTHTPMFQQFEVLGRRQGDLDGRSEGHARSDADVTLRPREDPAASQLLPLHRAQRGSRHHLSRLRRVRMQRVQADRMARDPRQRDGPSGRVRSGWLRP